MPPRLLGFVTRLLIAAILMGIVCMIQPFVFALFKVGFLVLLVATVLYTVVSHFPVRSSAAADTSVTEDVPIALGSPGNPIP